jgi:hypothetical protein
MHYSAPTLRRGAQLGIFTTTTRRRHTARFCLFRVSSKSTTRAKSCVFFSYNSAENSRRGDGLKNLDGGDPPAATAVKSEAFDIFQALTGNGIKGA